MNDMLISQRAADRINQQIKNELATAHAYLAMAFYLEAMGMKCMGKFFERQSDEERGHALRFVRYLQDVDAPVLLQALPTPRVDFASPAEVVEAAIESELRVTAQINEMVALAESERDYATRSFLKWFVDEQVEEVSSMRHLKQLLQLAGEGCWLQVEAAVRKLLKNKDEGDED